jgi:hypothetical protein
MNEVTGQRDDLIARLARITVKIELGIYLG